MGLEQLGSSMAHMAFSAVNRDIRQLGQAQAPTRAATTYSKEYGLDLKLADCRARRKAAIMRAAKAVAECDIRPVATPQ